MAKELNEKCGKGQHSSEKIDMQEEISKRLFSAINRSAQVSPDFFLVDQDLKGIFWAFFSNNSSV